MGCDIHCHIEYRLSNERSFRWFASPHIDRSYLLFTLLAGVQSDWVLENEGIEVSPLIAPRGIPKDASQTTLRSDDGWLVWCPSSRQWIEIDYHHPSWLNADEFRQVLEHYSGYLNDAETAGYATVELRAILAAMEALPEARLVFWFDN